MKNLQDMTDEELALSYIDGNNRAFDLLLSRNQQNVFSYIIFVVHDRETAEDIFQDTFLKVIARLQEGRYTNSGKFGAWVMRIAHNAIMDWYRDQSSRCIVKTTKDNDLSNIGGEDIIEGNIESTYVNNQVMSDVRRLLDLLPPVQREVVFMRYYQKLSFKEIADTTSVSINTALGRMRYALMNMRRIAKSNGISLQLC